MSIDIARIFARRLRANADHAEKQKFSVANLSTMRVADCRVLADFLEDVCDVHEASAMAEALRSAPKAAVSDAAMVALADLTDAFLSRHGCFPLDIATEEQRHWRRAMERAYELVGQPDTDARARAIRATTVPTRDGRPNG